MKVKYKKWRAWHLERMKNPEYAAKFRKDRRERERKNRRDPTKAPRIRAAENKGYAIDPRNSMLGQARLRAKRLDVPFSITKADIPLPEFCPAIGIRLYTGKGKISDNSPTIDRIRPALGYTIDNVVIISHLANRIKNNATADTLLKVSVWLRNLTKGDNLQ